MAAIENGEFTGSAELKDTKPDIPESCEDDVADANAEIDSKAEQLKMIEDFFEYMSTSLCAELDDQILAVLAANQDATSEPANAAVGLIGDLAMLSQRADEDIKDFNIRVFNDFLKSGIEPIEPDFS